MRVIKREIRSDQRRPSPRPRPRGGTGTARFAEREQHSQQTAEDLDGGVHSVCSLQAEWSSLSPHLQTSQCDRSAAEGDPTSRRPSRRSQRHRYRDPPSAAARLTGTAALSTRPAASAVSLPPFEQAGRSAMNSLRRRRSTPTVSLPERRGRPSTEPICANSPSSKEIRNRPEWILDRN